MKDDKKGKAYAHKNTKEKRPIGDFYETPRSLIWVVEKLIYKEFSLDFTILEPCCGRGAISEEIKKMGYKVKENDLFYGGVDYLNNAFHEKYIITNPPFSLWDDFVKKAKVECDKFMFIGRFNYFGTASRMKNGIWKNLKSVHCYNRYVDYRTPYRKDGNFHVGALCTGWFLWDKNYTSSPTLHFLDVQPYAKGGNIK